MKILRFSLICSIIIMMSCKEKSTSYRVIPIKTYADGFVHFDTIYGKDISRSDSIMYQYDNDDFKDSIDTLIIKENTTQLMGKILEPIRQKVFTIDGKKFKIEKYYYHGDGFHAFNIFYLNREQGIIVNTTHSDRIIEYDFVENQPLINKIISDSLFFGYE